MKTISVLIAAFLPALTLLGESKIIPLWPATPPGPAAKAEGAERDLTKPEDKLIAGRKIIKLGHVSTPQMHVYLPAKEKANGGAVLVCPGGGFPSSPGISKAPRWLNGSTASAWRPSS